MQEVEKKKRKIKDTILLLRKVYGYRMESEMINETNYQIKIDGVTVVSTSEAEKLEELLLNSIEIKGLEIKKEIYNSLSRLSSLYLNFLNDKGKREILKGIVPSVDKIVSAFFDISKYCSNEHIFDDCIVQDMTYEKLLLLFPKILKRLKEQKKEEKKKELLDYFHGCNTLTQSYHKIDELITSKQCYLEALEEVYPTYEDFFNFYQFSKNSLKENTPLPISNYETLYHIFLMKTIELKKQELERENKEYDILLKDYQDSVKKKTVLEIEPYFDTIQKTYQKLKKEKSSIEKKKEEKRNQLESKNQEYMDAETKKLSLLEKNFLFRLGSSKKIKELEEKLFQLEQFKLEDQKQLQKLELQEEKVLNDLSNNEQHLEKLCNFSISIEEFASLLKQTLKETTLEALKEKVKNLEESLMKYHLEKKEEELESICKRHSISIEDVSYEKCNC